MGRMYWMAVKMYLPTMLCLLGALGSIWALTNLGQSHYTAPLAASLSWMPYGLLALAGLLGIVTSVRLWRWEAGRALICTCGGLLGREHLGRYGLYRKCMACGRNHASR